MLEIKVRIHMFIAGYLACKGSDFTTLEEHVEMESKFLAQARIDEQVIFKEMIPELRSFIPA